METKASYQSILTLNKKDRIPMNTENLITQLKSISEYVDDDYGYQRYMRREMFEKVVFGEIGLEFCSCCPVDDALKDVYDALVFASIKDKTARFLFLHENFGTGDVSKKSMLLILFHLLTSKGLIDHADDADMNDSFITELGTTFLPLLFEYLDLGAMKIY